MVDILHERKHTVETQNNSGEKPVKDNSYTFTDMEPPITMLVSDCKTSDYGREALVYLKGFAPGLGYPNDRAPGGVDETIIHLKMPETIDEIKRNEETGKEYYIPFKDSPPYGPIIGKQCTPLQATVEIYIRGFHDAIGGTRIVGLTGPETVVSIEGAYKRQSINPMTFESTRARFGDRDPRAPQ